MNSRRTFLKTTGLAVATLAAAGGRSFAAPTRKPNIILIMADDIGCEGIGCYGSADYKTPNLDRLAEDGMRFTHCYSQPLCTPSRVQIMTGRYNHRNYVSFGYLDTKEITFANLLKEKGYATCIAGKWQLSGDADTIKGFGFDEHCLWNMQHYGKGEAKVTLPNNNRKRYSGSVLYVNGEWKKGGYGPQNASDLICSFIERNKDKPFLCYYPMILVHDPFDPTPDSENKKGGGPRSNFADMVAYMDKIVGQIIEQLKKSNVLDNTIILFTGDNGTHGSITSKMKDGRTVKGGKGQTNNAGTHVPLIAYWKDVTPKGVVSDDLIDFTDFFATLAEAADGEMPTDRKMDGISFLPQLKGETGQKREWVYCYYVKRGKNVKQNSPEFIRDKRWKLYGNGGFCEVTENGTEQKPTSEQMAGEGAVAKKKLEAALKEVNEKEE